MAGRSEDDEEAPERGVNSGRLLLVAVLVLAVVATAVLVLTNNAQWLRLGVLAALWAALLGAFLAAKYRRQVTDREDEVAGLQSVYELELEREVAARREYELEIEAETRQRIAEERQDDIAALRAELHAMRENLDRLTGGEVLVERIALRAQSTRMRTFADPSARMITAPEQPHRSITAGQPNGSGRSNGNPLPVGRAPDPEVLDSATSLIPAYVEQARSENSQGRNTSKAAALWPESLPDRAHRNGSPIVLNARADNEPSRAMRPPADKQRREDQPRIERVEPAQRHPGQESAPRRKVPSRQEVPPRREPAPGQESAPRRERSEEWPGQASWPPSNPLPARPAPDHPAADHSGSNIPRKPTIAPPARPSVGPGTNSIAARSAVNSVPASASSGYSVPPPVSNGHPSSNGHPAPPLVSSPLPNPVSNGTPNGMLSQRLDEGFARSPGESSGHRPSTQQSQHRIAAPAPMPPAQPPSRSNLTAGAVNSGGRRRAEEPSQWQEHQEWQPETAPSAQRPSAQRAEPEPAGAHTAGRSVNDLLAAMAADNGPRRHRRAD